MNSRLSRFLAVSLYKVVYEIIYMCFSSNIFSYMGVIFMPNVTKAVVSYVILFLILLLPQKRDTVSKYLLDIYLIFSFVPMLSFYWQGDKSTAYIFMCTVCFVMLYMGSYCFNGEKTKRIIVGDLFQKIDVLKVLLVINVFVMIAFTISHGFADLRALDFANVYELRSERSYSTLWEYLIRWIQYAFIPIMMCISLKKRKYSYLIIAVAMQFYIYLYTGMKSALFSIGLILFSFYLVEKRKPFIEYWVLALTGLSTVASLISYKSISLLAIFPVRLSSIPAIIQFNHYDFFSQNEKLYMAENFIGRLLGIKSPYNMFSTFLVTGGNGNANTGYLADAYANGGFVMMVIYTMVLIILLRYIDRLYKTFHKEYLSIYVGVLTYSMLFLMDGSLTSALITGGLIVILFVLMQLQPSWFDND